VSQAHRLKRLKQEHERRVGRRDSILEDVTLSERALVELDAEEVKLTKAIEILQAAVETRREELRDRVEVLVTRGLRAVFGREDFEFAFNVQTKADVINVIPVLRSMFGERVLETEIADGHGGGVADVIAFVLRVLVLTLTRPKVAPIMILDESFRHVSPNYLRGVATLLAELNQTAGIQFLLVTHKPELLDAADVVYRAHMNLGGTEFHLEHDTRDCNYHARPKQDQRLEPPTPFAHEDMTWPDDRRAEPKRSATVDARANRQRYLADNKVPWEGLEEKWAEARRKRYQRERMRRYRKERRAREPEWDWRGNKEKD